MRNPDDVRRLLRGTWRRHVGAWLGGHGDWPLRVGLAAPGERDAAAHWEAFEAWRGAWRDWHGGEVECTERHWSLLGVQTVPQTLSFADAATVAAVLDETARWERASARFDRWQARWPGLAGSLQHHFDLLADIDADEFARCEAMLAWLARHPASGLFIRQLPVAGLDTKWLETRTGILGEWLQALGDAAAPRDFWHASGLRREPDRIRLRLLDPALRRRVGGLSDLQAPIDEVAALDLPVRDVFIVENQQTGLAFGDLPDTAVVLARGYAVERLPELGWLTAANVHYWGDLDTHGLAILGRVRGHLPQTTSLLMDAATLLAHRALWVEEPQPHAAARIDHLTAEEQALYADLRGDRWGVRVRLEQERIGWNTAWRAILCARAGHTPLPLGSARAQTA